MSIGGMFGNTYCSGNLFITDNQLEISLLFLKFYWSIYNEFNCFTDFFFTIKSQNPNCRIQNFWFVNINFLMSAITFEPYFWPTNQYPNQGRTIVRATNLPLLSHRLNILHQPYNLNGFWKVPSKVTALTISQVLQTTL